ncbi:hypothetical protein [Mechercharimyces sp. CAU 1602]|nr:hypothetical protein [Mechercharimyces sp. CAU 1602]MCS1352340.1 hypothetical protein [Mechercharimyces sp. CAU 1602]
MKSFKFVFLAFALTVGLLSFSPFESDLQADVKESAEPSST